jgi:hypothetical protein
VEEGESDGGLADGGIGSEKKDPVVARGPRAAGEREGRGGCWLGVRPGGSRGVREVEVQGGDGVGEGRDLLGCVLGGECDAKAGGVFADSWRTDGLHENSLVAKVARGP